MPIKLTTLFSPKWILTKIHFPFMNNFICSGMMILLFNFRLHRNWFCAKSAFWGSNSWMCQQYEREMGFEFLPYLLWCKMNHIVELKTYFHATLDYNPTVWGGTHWKWNFGTYWTLNHCKGSGEIELFCAHSEFNFTTSQCRGDETAKVWLRVLHWNISTCESVTFTGYYNWHKCSTIANIQTIYPRIQVSKQC